MRAILGIAVAAIAIASFGLSTTPASAANPKGAYAQKKAECKQEAKAKHFGIHWVKRDRWIKNCIAGQRT